jgi:sensor histidine kinase YesM
MNFNIKRINLHSFWFFQITGWLIFYFADVLLIVFVRKRTFYGFVEETLQDFTLFFLTSLLRLYYKKINHREISLLSIILISIFWAIIVTAVWYPIIIVYAYIFQEIREVTWMLQFRQYILWIAYLAPLIFGWSTLYFGIKFWRDWNVQKERSKNANIFAQRARLEMLRYQLNPHFLFNALNSIRALMNEDTSNAKAMITELSEFLRYSLLSQNQMEMNLRDELNAIRYYLAIEKKRFEDKLEISFEVDADTEDFPMLGFLIHPIVENAIKYGMKTSKLPLHIKIRAFKKDGNLHLSVINSGTWFKKTTNEDQQSGTGTGLENVRARLDNAFPQGFKLDSFEQNGFVHVNIEIYKDKAIEANQVKNQFHKG